VLFVLYNISYFVVVVIVSVLRFSVSEFAVPWLLPSRCPFLVVVAALFFFLFSFLFFFSFLFGCRQTWCRQRPTRRVNGTRPWRCDQLSWSTWRIVRRTIHVRAGRIYRTDSNTCSTEVLTKDKKKQQQQMHILSICKWLKVVLFIMMRTTMVMMAVIWRVRVGFRVTAAISHWKISISSHLHHYYDSPREIIFRIRAISTLISALDKKHSKRSFILKKNLERIKGMRSESTKIDQQDLKHLEQLDFASVPAVDRFFRRLNLHKFRSVGSIDSRNSEAVKMHMSVSRAMM